MALPYSRTSWTAASSCVMPRTSGAPFRSEKRISSLPTLSYRPDSCQSDAGSTTGNCTSCPSILSISSRMICLDLAGDPPQRQIGRINAIGHIFHVAAAQHQGVTVDHAVGGPLFKTVSYQLFQLHINYLRSKMNRPEKNGFRPEKEYKKAPSHFVSLGRTKPVRGTT